MKGILIFSSLSDLLFLKADNGFYQYLASKSRQPGTREEVPLSNMVLQLFSPLITSYKVMQSQFYNPYTSVECENGVLVAFAEYAGFYLIAIGNMMVESLSLLQHRLGVFLTLVKMLFGPALHLLKENSAPTDEYRNRIKLLSQMIDAWDLLRIKEPSFLVEAVERILANHNLGATSVNLLKTVLEKVRASCRTQESVFCHAFLIVDSKLLALYSSRNASQLMKEDLLLLILMTAALHSSNDCPVNKEKQESMRIISEGGKDKRVDSSDSDEFFIPKPASSARSPNSAGKTGKRNEMPVTEGKDQKEQNNKYFHTLVFLRSSLGTVIPHVIYTISVIKSIVLVIVQEVTSKAGVASGISNMLDVLITAQLQNGEGRNQHTVDCLETNFKKISDATKKLRLLPHQEQSIKNVTAKWERLKSEGLFYFLKSAQQRHMSSKLEAALTAMCDALKLTFGEVFLHFGQGIETYPLSNLNPVIQTVQSMVRRRLADCTDYLLVKAECNITISSYLQDYPDLIHFVYIDRSKNYVLAPSMSFSEQVDCNATSSMHEKVIKMIDLVNRYLQFRHFSLSWQEEDLCFSYFLWFEDPSGKAIKPKTFPEMKDFPLPGILCGDFYTKLTKECFPAASLDYINCYEIYCIHKSSPSFSAILEQVQRLTASLWEISGAAYNPLDLL